MSRFFLHITEICWLELEEDKGAKGLVFTRDTPNTKEHEQRRVTVGSFWQRRVTSGDRWFTDDGITMRGA